jgi:hypothetical protein
MRESVARGSGSGINITPSEIERYKQEQSRGMGGGGGYASLGASGIHGATIATSSLKTGIMESTFRSPSGINESMVRSPEEAKQFQSPSRTGSNIG